MNRREIALNTLLGLLLVLAFATPFVVGIVALGFVLNTVDLVVKHFFPGFVRHSDVAYDGFVCLCALISGLGHLRKRHWSSAFLCFAALPMIASFALAGPGSAFGDDNLFVLIWVLIILLTSRVRPTQLEFMGSAFVIGASFAINAGLLGSGTVKRIAMCGVILATLGLAGAYFRREHWRRHRAEGPSLTRA